MRVVPSAKMASRREADSNQKNGKQGEGVATMDMSVADGKARQLGKYV